MNPFLCNEEPVRMTGNECEEEAARIRHVFFIRKGTNIDQSTPAAMKTALLAAVAACNGYMIANVNGTYDGSTAKKGKGRGSEPERTTGRGHSITFTDFDAVPKNVRFWNRAAYVGQNYNMFFMTGSQAWPVEGPNLDIDPKIPISDDAEAIIEGEITVKWSGKYIPEPVAVEMAGLETPPTLATTGLTTVAPGAQTINGTAVTVVTGGNVKFAVGVTGATAFELESGSVLPAGLTLDAVTGQISGVAGPAAPAVQFTIVGRNACGISNKIEITYTVTAA
jgi:hypothetical protein